MEAARATHVRLVSKSPPPPPHRERESRTHNRLSLHCIQCIICLCLCACVCVLMHRATGVYEFAVLHTHTRRTKHIVGIITINLDTLPDFRARARAFSVYSVATRTRTKQRGWGARGACVCVEPQVARINAQARTCHACTRARRRHARYRLWARESRFLKNHHEHTHAFGL